MKFCMKCGAFYEVKEGVEGCPKCAEAAALLKAAEEAEIAHTMDEKTAKRLRKRAWLELLIGVPAFIGFIYGLLFLFRRLRG
ncbi:MAG: hypothetical protein IJB22_01185 [Clostridia bacterium]|nr:hypothetical protein [Clostridia bacterium]MBQ6692356.1 hypothetical protein [Clostridia bacterium]MBQ7112685.1 hypothetical protein [Clostridia bacterium]